MLPCGVSLSHGDDTRWAAVGYVRRLPSGRYQARFTVSGSACTRYVNAPSTFATKASATLRLAKQRTLIAEGKLNDDCHYRVRR